MYTIYSFSGIAQLVYLFILVGVFFFFLSLIYLRLVLNLNYLERHVLLPPKSWDCT